MDHNLKNKVKSYYGGIAKNIKEGKKSYCGCGDRCCGDVEDNTELYTKEHLDNLPEEAIKASQGCANPIFLANLPEG